jgi:hypothetical protein
LWIPVTYIIPFDSIYRWVLWKLHWTVPCTSVIHFPQCFQFFFIASFFFLIKKETQAFRHLLMHRTLIIILIESCLTATYATGRRFLVLQ